MRPCGILVLMSKLFTAESKTQVYGHLHDYYARHPHTAREIGTYMCNSVVTYMYVWWTQMSCFCAEFICYDDACHLRRFSRNSIQVDLTEHTKQLASVEMVVDKMHMKGHTDKWCKEHCDPAEFSALSKVTCFNYFCILVQFTVDYCCVTVCRYRSVRTSILVAIQIYTHYTENGSTHFHVFLLYIIDLHNIREEKKLLRAGFISQD